LTCQKFLLPLSHRERHDGGREGEKTTKEEETTRKLTRETSAVIERNLRAEILHERKTMLEAELAKERVELGQLGLPGPAVARRTTRSAPRPTPGVPATPGPSGRRMAGTGARSFIIQTLKRTKRAMTIKELTRTILRKDWKTVRHDPTKMVDAALRNNPQEFRKAAPSTFELVRGKWGPTSSSDTEPRPSDRARQGENCPQPTVGVSRSGRTRNAGEENGDNACSSRPNRHAGRMMPAG
jgi:hypothetical protein